ncbi:hypothetical protein ALC62_00171 [Cyphomyrmex costatus]|uniref:Uncharacterized protein n=1 Tax=Cyphomyrmex costatus TaxID=456900 RepID=A0A151K2A3_9HYME|nr:hypothetical protein ALC62_00171 [Cyphomyrmex costatus]
MENEMEDLLYRATRIDTLEAYQVWKINCVEYLDYLKKVYRNTRHPISGLINSSIAKIVRLESVRVVNSSYTEPQQFLNDARDTVLDQIRVNLQRHACLKMNTTFNGEFIADDKRSVKSIATKNHELYGASDLKEWYDEYVTDAISSSLEEFQERDSG